MTYDVEHLFMYLFTIHISSLVRCLFRSFAYFLIGFIFFIVEGFFKKINLFIYFYFWLCWVFVAAHELLSSCSEQGLLFVEVHRLLVGWLPLLQSMGSRHVGFSSCGTRAQ